MGVPIYTEYTKIQLARDSTPAMYAALAAYRQGEPKGDRFVRSLLRRSVVEGRDVTNEEVFLEGAQESGLDLAKFRRDLKDRDGLRREADRQGEGLPTVPLGFYNLAVEDDRGRRIVLDHAFEPADVESAIDYLSGGKLRRNQPTDPGVYLQATGPAPTIELARAFGWTRVEAERRLAQLEKEGRVHRQTLAGAPHWAAT